MTDSLLPQNPEPKPKPRVRISVTVSVQRTDSSMSLEKLELRDEATYDEWDLRGLNRILRRIKSAMDAERRIAAAPPRATPLESR